MGHALHSHKWRMPSSVFARVGRQEETAEARLYSVRRLRAGRCFWRKLVTDRGRHLHKRKGSYLFRAGEPVGDIWILRSGKVKLCVGSPDGREMIIGIFAGGEAIWEGLFLNGSLYPYSAVCLTTVDVCAIPVHDFQTMLQDTSVAWSILEPGDRPQAGGHCCQSESEAGDCKPEAPGDGKGRHSEADREGEASYPRSGSHPAACRITFSCRIIFL